jgi:hypothetical protein
MAYDRSLVLPSELPWSSLRGEALEELLFWLCDALGAKDLEWRAGSTSGTSRDGGRDIEATFHLSAPDGEPVPERWWIQAKGRRRTVEPAAVKAALLDAQADPDVDVLVIATNSRFSNDTRDIVRKSAQAHPRPRVRLWDRSQLERILARHPSVVARVAPEALSDAGRLAALTERFWERLDYPTGSTLKRLWECRDELEFDGRSLMAVLCGEAANGDLDLRPWGATATNEALQDMLVLGLANMPMLLFRTEPYGGSWDPPRVALAYALACALLRFEPESIIDVLDNPWRHVDVDDQAAEAMQAIRDETVRPVIAELRDFLVRPCEADCVRVSADFEERDSVDVAVRWNRFLTPDGQPPRKTRDDRMIVLEKMDAPCNAGLSLDEDRTCPFFDHDADWQDLVRDYARVLENRVRRHAASATPGSGVRGA